MYLNIKAFNTYMATMLIQPVFCGPSVDDQIDRVPLYINYVNLVIFMKLFIEPDRLFLEEIHLCA